MLISVSEGLNQANEFINVSADWEIADGHVTEGSLVVDDVGGSEGYSLIFDKAAVRLRNLSGGVGEHRDGHGAETSLLSILLGVLLVAEVRVGGACNNLAATLLEFSGFVIELGNLSRTNESEIERIEE